MAEPTIELLADDAIFTESPRWHGGAYWFSDIGGGKIHRVDLDGKIEVITSGIVAPSGMGWTRSGDLLVTSLLTSTIYRVGTDNKPVPFAGPEQHGTEGTNDMATAGSRSYVSCGGHTYKMGDDEATLSKAVGTVITIDHESGNCRIVASGLQMPNGIAISPDGKTLVLAELYAQRILHYDILADGSLSSPRTFAKFDHMADGISLDAEGGLWVGAGTHFQRFDAMGKAAEKIEIPGWSCVAPMLGGPDGRTLMMATNQMEKPEDIFTGKAKGRIYITKVAVPAAREADFS